MYISTNWIKDFVDLDGIDIENLIYRFTMSTAEVEGITKYGFDTVGVVVGKIENIEKIENSDKLSKVTVDIGKEKIQSICGAKNIFVGAKVVFAPAGSKVQGVEVKENIIDGTCSKGICLSEKELGISTLHDGVMLLDEDVAIGTDIKQVLPIEDIVFEVDNKSLTNRPDLWGHYGIAREIAAITKRNLKPLKLDDLDLYNNLPSLDIKVEDKEACYRYTGITVENITKKVSPYVMKIRLFYTGLRSINLLADITNYVMLEIGQPMHAFDKRYVDKVHVKSLKEDEEFITLDGIKRNLPKDTLMITNGNENIGIAGIKGGLNTQIMDDTTSLFLESATFDSTLIRKTAIKISLRTDASARYEKTLDPEFAKIATARFLRLLKENDENIKVTSAYTDVYLKKYPTIKIDIEKEFFDRYIGINIPMDVIVDTLRRLEFDVTQKENTLRVIVPSFRATKDVSIKADLVEEVARIYGYDNIKPKSNLWEVSPIKEDEIRSIEYETKRMLAEKFGLSEIHSYVWYNEDKNKELGIKVEDNLKIVNGLNKKDSTLREYMAPTMLYYISNNLRYLPECNIFEIGRTFKYSFDNNDCVEKKVLGIGLASLNKSEEELLYEAKKIIDSIFKIQKNKEVKCINNNGSINYSWIHKINSYIVNVDDKNMGYISAIHPRIIDNVNKKASIVVIELRIDNMDKIQKNDVIYKHITKYQTVNLDLTMIVDKDVMYEQIEKVIKEANLKFLMEYNLTYIYENEEKMPGKKSVTIRFTIGSYEKTLSKEEIDLELNTLIENFDKNNMHINK